MRVSLILCCLLMSCSVVTINIGQKTSLEKQLIGELEPLTEEQILTSSVRAAVVSMQGLSVTEIQALALEARRRQIFNSDDITAFKTRGCLGEAQTGSLTLRECSTPDKNLLDRLVTEENADRQTIIDWAVAIDPGLTPSDRPQVAAVYRRMLAGKARPGDWLQGDDGVWVKK